MLKRFMALREDSPGNYWLSRFIAGRSETERWYCGEGRAAPPTVAECKAALLQHMPELASQYERACALVGDDEFAHRMLSHYRPAPAAYGCSQAVWLGSEGPALVRNYDFSLEIVSEWFESNSWIGREVIAKTQRPWGGCLDGMNADGLVASATFGGSRSQGLGFSIILMLRYVLETCTRVAEGVEALCRIPVALSHNVTLLDRTGTYATIFLGPDRSPAVSRIPVCTNHQDTKHSMESPATKASVERHLAASQALNNRRMTLADLTARFLEPPLYSRKRRSPTVYSAVYRPRELRVDYFWPGKCWTQRIGQFETGEYTHDYGELVE